MMLNLKRTVLCEYSPKPERSLTSDIKSLSFGERFSGILGSRKRTRDDDEEVVFISEDIILYVRNGSYVITEITLGDFFKIKGLIYRVDASDDITNNDYVIYTISKIVRTR